MDKEIKRIRWVLFGICILFISLIVYLTYFKLAVADNIKNSSYNKRLWMNEEKIARGKIVDRKNEVLAHSEAKEDGTYKRVYNYGNLYSHLIGYSYRAYGKVGLELEYNNPLLAISENLSINEIKNLVNPSKEGNDLRLTIDHQVQEKSRQLLEGRKGSIVALNPSTGEIYSMVSMPDFNTSKLGEEWNSIVESQDSPFLNRATSGLYPPGSSFKIVTASGLLSSPGLDLNYDCKGTTVIDGYSLKDYSKSGHGRIDMETALAKSCNTYFAEKGVAMGKDKLLETAGKFYINKNIPFDLPTKTSKLPSDMTMTELAASSIGQGKLMVTPLNMAMISGAIANGGKLMKPVLVKNIISPKGHIVKTQHPEVLSEPLSLGDSEELTKMMLAVVNQGTGGNAALNNIQVAGKTGTAENPSGKSHAWFTGFAPADDPRVAVAVVLEEDGTTGGKTAAPIAREIIKEVLNNIK